jgi:citrate lyase beta subunit
VLYVPGDNQKALAKSALLPIDTVMIDLEDGAKDKKAAREGAVFALKNVDFGPRQVVVRVNGRGTGLGRLDMMALFSDADALRRIDAVAIPKAESRLDIDEVAEGLNDAASRRDVLKGQPMPIWAVIETAAGVLSCHELCREAAAPRHHNGLACKLAALVAGTSDLTKDLRARHTQDRAPMLASLSHIVLAARASGLLALDGVFLDLRKSTETTATFERHCQQGRDMVGLGGLPRRVGQSTA